LEVFDFGGCVEVALDELSQCGEERLVSDFESQRVVEEGPSAALDRYIRVRYNCGRHTVATVVSVKEIAL
jgi:hypothetical protein